MNTVRTTSLTLHLECIWKICVAWGYSPRGYIFWDMFWKTVYFTFFHLVVPGVPSNGEYGSGLPFFVCNIQPQDGDFYL